MIAGIGGNAIAATDESPIPADGLTTFQFWSLIIAGLALLGIGTIAAALITAAATRRRERDAWLRQEQVERCDSFYTKMVALRHHIAGTTDRALGHVHFDGLEEAVNELPSAIAEMIGEYSSLAIVCEPATMKVVEKVIEIGPSLAHQSVPLPGVTNPAAHARRMQALEAFATLEATLVKVMKADFRLMKWTDRRKFYKSLVNLDSYVNHTLSSVDQPENPFEPYVVLASWRVRPLYGDGVPKADADEADIAAAYLVDPTRLELEGKRLKATAIKMPKIPWRLGISRAVPVDEQRELAKDAARLISGHGGAFDLRMDPVWVSIDDGQQHVWGFLEDA